MGIVMDTGTDTDMVRSSFSFHEAQGMLLKSLEGHSHAKTEKAHGPVAEGGQITNEVATADESGAMNIRALLLHIVGDALGNLSVIASGLIVWLTKVHWKQYIDPTASVVIAFIMFLTTLSLGEIPHQTQDQNC